MPSVTSCPWDSVSAPATSMLSILSAEGAAFAPLTDLTADASAPVWAFLGTKAVPSQWILKTYNLQNSEHFDEK